MIRLRIIYSKPLSYKLHKTWRSRDYITETREAGLLEKWCDVFGLLKREPAAAKDIRAEDLLSLIDRLGLPGWEALADLALCWAGEANLIDEENDNYVILSSNYRFRLASKHEPEEIVRSVIDLITDPIDGSIENSIRDIEKDFLERFSFILRAYDLASR